MEPFNIRTRIELETRVLAAALKQSFERGDSDGVSLAHRQLFLLLKDQKSGNGAQIQTENGKTKNGDAGSHREDRVDIQEQPAFAPAAFSEPELTDFDERSETTADVEPEVVYAEPEISYIEPEVTYVESEASSAEPGSSYSEVAEVQHDQASGDEYENESKVETREKSAFEILEEAYEAELARQRGEEATDSEQETGRSEFEQETGESRFELETSESGVKQETYASQFEHEAEIVQSESSVAAEDALEISAEVYEEQRPTTYDQSTSTESQLKEQRLAEAETQFASQEQQLVANPFEPVETPVSETGEHPVAETAKSPYSEGEATEQAQAIAQYLRYKKTREQILAQEVADRFATHKAAEANEGTEGTDPEAAAAFRAERESQPGFETEEEAYIRMRKPEPPKKVELAFEQPSDEYAKVFGAPPTESSPSSQTPGSIQSDTGDFQPAAAQIAEDIDLAAQHLGQAFSHSERAAAHPEQQQVDYEALKAEQSRPRNMPAIDFSLSSETSTKPDIDFTLSSEVAAKPVKPRLPDIDFSLESEAKGPNIDFSMEAESRAKPEEKDFLSAPTGGGFIEAEFVSQESDAVADEYANQDVTSELPVLNPNASLYIQPDEVQAQNVAPPRPTQPEAQSQPAAAPSLPPRPPLDPAFLAGLPRLAAPTPKPAEPAPPVPVQPAAAQAQETTSQEEPVPPAVPRPPDLYALLGVSQMSPFEEIHKNFLRKIRRILRKLRGTVRPERDELLKDLRRHWVARDILCDPVTRTDYDFRDMGLRGSPEGAPQIPDDGPQRIGQRTPLRIGELLQCAGLLEMAELEIACDMHKAMPEVQFGTFLVRQGFIQERDLESVLLGQSLLREGKITVAQFQVAMELSQSRGANIADTLIEHGYINAAELQKLMSKQAAPEPAAESDTPKIKEIDVKPRVIEPPPTNLNASSAVPTWKDQLDWSKPLPVDDDASLMDRDPQKQSLANLLGGKSEPSQPLAEADLVKISNNAAPSWKDQLDWEKPAEEETIQPQTQPNEPQEAQSSLSVTNAVPSWKDQLDWEQPKPETSDATTSDASQRPPEHSTFGGHETSSETGSAADDEHDVATDEHDAASDEHDAVSDEHDATADAPEGTPENPEPDEKEGFFKKNFGKFRSAKDKKKKRK